MGETMNSITRQQAIEAMIKFYPQARQQLAETGAFGKTLDNKARKLAIKLAGIILPDGLTIAWATPDDWASDGYRNPAPLVTSPTPSQIVETRNSVGLSQPAAAALISSTKRTWQDWEAGIAKMHPGLWELFLIKTGQSS